ncbi:MAG: thioredoxin [DPANN group archaeon]|nr:thioredoxin [DPANN group archaeon]
MQELNDKDFDEQISKDTPLLVDFWAEWCGPCKVVGPILEELSGEYTDRLRFAKLNTEEYQEITGRFGIMGIPTMIVFRQGKEVGRLVGALPKEHLKDKIDEMLASI